MNEPILLVSNFLSGSGGSRGVCEELAERLAPTGRLVLTTSNKRPKILRLFDMIRTVCKERRRYVLAQVDVYSGQAFIWAEITCWLLRHYHKPYILTLHGGSLPVFSRRHPKRVKHLLESAQVVTTPSQYLHRRMALFRRDLLILPNALDLSRYQFRLRDNPEASLVWLRAFHQTYNPSLAAQVLELLVQQFPQARMTMVGPDKKDGSLQAMLRLAQQLQLEERICIAGGVPKPLVPEWMNRGDLFLNTTNVDNAPVSVLEAMACGLCVVSTNVGGLPDLLVDGEDALLVRPNDPQAMAAALVRVLTDSRLAARLSRNGRVKAEQHDWSVVLPQWECLIQQVATRN